MSGFRAGEQKRVGGGHRGRGLPRPERRGRARDRGRGTAQGRGRVSLRGRVSAGQGSEVVFIQRCEQVRPHGRDPALPAEDQARHQRPQDQGGPALRPAEALGQEI